VRKLTTLLLLGAACGTALASTEIQSPCPETVAQTDVLQAIVEDKSAPLSEAAAKDKAQDTTEEVESPVSDTKAPEFTTRLPGVSANDMPGFRRHMFRTDI
jgi:Tfp pilus assembly protein FimV